MAYVCCIKTNILRSILKHFLTLKSSNFLLSSKEIKTAHGVLKVVWALGTVPNGSIFFAFKHVTNQFNFLPTSLKSFNTSGY